ncbi:MAG: ribosome silencing factor [Spirochaetota bacterium]|nr:ribosome silencing factor [Spirochaetota bacterium]
MIESDLQDNRIVDIARDCARLLDEKKAADIIILDLSKINNYFDYFIISTGNSFLHCRSLGREIRKLFKAISLKERSKSKLDSGWILLDYTDIVVHIFTQEMREFYQLEKLWADATRIVF